MTADKAEIYCPKCEWHPAPSWNTFWARGACSGCGVKWPSTQCFDCNQYSPDEAWYHYREPSESVKAETADTEKQA